jgi:membrane protein DedA with SNARE-associated domain
MSKGIPVLGALLALLPLTSCSSEKWFDERMAEAHTLSPAAIAAFLFGGGFVSEDLTCVSAGVLVSKGSLPYWLAALSCTLGVWVSDSLLYFWGLLGRRGLLERAPLRWIVKRAQIERGTGLFERHGAKVLILSRFMPGSRVPIYLAAGFLNYPFPRFAAWMALAAALWAPVMVWLALKLGDALLAWLERYEKIAWIAMPTVVFVIWLGMRGFEKLVVRRGEKLLGETLLEDPTGSVE